MLLPQKVLFPLLLALASPAMCAPPAHSDTASVQQTLEPFFAKHCVQCHNSKVQSAGVNLDLATHPIPVMDERGEWDHVLDKLRNGEMPPKGLPRPPRDDLDRVMAAIESHVTELESNAKPDPGRVTARRLNRAEYNNTLRDLLAVDLQPADDFPADDSGYGFDNIGDVLTLSPILMEKYFSAARKVADRAIARQRTFKPTISRYQMKRPGEDGDLTHADYVISTASGKHFKETHAFPVFGEYDVVVRVVDRRDEKSNPGPARFIFTLDGKPVQAIEFEKGEKPPNEFSLWVAAGDRKLEGWFVQDPATPQEELMDEKGPKVFLDYVELRGPIHPQPPAVSASYQKIFTCGQTAEEQTPSCAERILAPLARRAYRRTPAERELNDLKGLFQMARSEGDSFEESIGVALQAMLVSPSFLFRIERDADPQDPAAIHKINQFELASRLSYFLWSSMPDDRLLDLAEAGKLGQPDVLQGEVERMLADPKSEALVENFAGQWLELRNLAKVKPDPDLFPEFDDELRASMKKETELFFDYILRHDRPITEFLDAKYTFLNERLARHYGVKGIVGDDFQKVDVDGKERGGLVTQGSVLTVSSYPTRTSPVLRGVWVLENLLGTPPPPPPPDVPQLDTKNVGNTGTLRQQLEAHRANPSCAVCHAKLDPMGFGLENYDAVGKWRTHEGKFPVDASGKLPNGETFDSPAELKQLLVKKSDQFGECVTEKLLTYALGRGLERYDKPVVKEINGKLAADNYRFSRLVTEIVQSMPFQMRRGEGAHK